MDEEYLKEMLMKKYNELTEKRSLKSRIKGFTDAAARAWQMRLKSKLISLGDEIRNTKDVGTKMDLLAKQIQVHGAMTLVGSNVGADGYMAKGSVVSGFFTEEDIEECLR